MPITDWSDRIIIAEMSDEPAFSDEIDALLRRLEECDVGGPDVIIDLKGVTYLNSSNLAQLLKIRKKIIMDKRRLRICSATDGVWSVMLTTGLDSIFTFTDDVSTSLASLQLA
jgi:anti-anti-sigma factor